MCSLGENTKKESESMPIYSYMYRCMGICTCIYITCIWLCMLAHVFPSMNYMCLI
jgi:hypothetical protein